MTTTLIIIILIFIAVMGWLNALRYALIARAANDLINLTRSYSKDSAWALVKENRKERTE